MTVLDDIRSAELAAAELSVLLAGTADLPLDPAHPAMRISELLALAGIVAGCRA